MFSCEKCINLRTKISRSEKKLKTHRCNTIVCNTKYYVDVYVPRDMLYAHHCMVVCVDAHLLYCINTAY